jgi:hypothetical protein
MAGRIALAALVMLVGLAAPAPAPFVGRAHAAAGDESAAIGKITLLNRQAIEEYGKLNFDEAQRLLDQALDLAASAGLTQHPIRARTYVTLGVVTAGGLKRRDVAVRLFRKALQIQPEIQLSAELGTPEVRAAFDEAVQGLGSEPKIERLPSELLVHDPLTTGGRGEAITIAVTPDDALRAERLVLAYRAAGASTFSKIKMQKQSDGVFEAVIPAPATAGREVAYYIEARDLDDKLVAARGSPIAAMVIALEARAGVGSTAEAAPAAPAAEAPAADSAMVSVARAPEAARATAARPRLFVAVQAGTGIGWSNGTAEATGYAIGGLKFGGSRLGQLEPQIGYLVTPQLILSLWARLQLVRGADAYRTPPGSVECGGDGSCAAATGAFAGFVSATWLFGGSDDAVRPFLSLAAGGGLVRQVVRVDSANRDCGADRAQPTCLDTASLGPLLGGPGLGLHLRLSSAVRLVFSVQSLFAAPRFAANLDANAGLALLF